MFPRIQNEKPYQRMDYLIWSKNKVRSTMPFIILDYFAFFSLSLLNLCMKIIFFRKNIYLIIQRYRLCETWMPYIHYMRIKLSIIHYSDFLIRWPCNQHNLSEKLVFDKDNKYIIKSNIIILSMFAYQEVESNYLCNPSTLNVIAKEV